MKPATQLRPDNQGTHLTRMPMRDAILLLRPVVRALLPWCLDHRTGTLQVVFSDGVPKHMHRGDIIRFGKDVPEPTPWPASWPPGPKPLTSE